MGKKRSTKATASIQPYVGPELLDTPEQREVDQDQTTGSPAQEAALGPSETAAESAKTPNLYDVYEPVARRFFDLQFRPAEITTGSPAQEAVASPSEPETIQASPKARRRSKKRNSTRNKLILGYAEKGNDIKKITTMMNTIHGEDMGYDAVQKVILRARPTDKNEDK